MHYDVAVVGLGIVGASAVYAAAWAGARVLALDAGTPGGGTSGSSFAWLNSVRKEPDAYHRLNAAGMTAHRELSRELGGDAGYHDGGSLEWADGDDAERALRTRGDRVEALVLDDGEATASSVLVCVGPATQAFLEPLGVVIPVGRVPGLLAVTSHPATALGRVVHAPGIHLRPDAGGGLLLGAEDVDTLAANAGSPAALSGLLLERAAHVFPAARQLRIANSRTGVRPMPGDRHTIAGRIPGLANGWLIATHSGITLGPLLGRLMADEIVHDKPSSTLAPFRPDRFLTAGMTTG